MFMGRDFGHTRDFSEEIAAEIDKEVKKIVDDCYANRRKLLNENKDMLEYISKKPWKKKQLTKKNSLR